MKIIYSNNIPTNTSNEYLWLDKIPNAHKETAQRVCDKLNEALKIYHGGSYYGIVEDDHKLYAWEP